MWLVDLWSLAEVSGYQGAAVETLCKNIVIDFDKWSLVCRTTDSTREGDEFLSYGSPTWRKAWADCSISPIEIIRRPK